MPLRTALIIEDDISCSDLIEMVLSSIPDLSVQTVRNGIQARKHLASSRVYSLVITDFRLPGEDGLSLIQAIRAMPSRSGLPVLMVTSTTDLEVRRKAEAVGANGFFEKPFSPARLLEAVHSLLNGI